MANVTIKDLLDALAAKIGSVGGDDRGVILTRERFTESEEGFAQLFTALEQDGQAKGWLIQWIGLTQRKGELICTVRQIHQFAIEFLYPYEDKRKDGLTSHEVAVTRIEDVNNALNEVPPNTNPWNLGITEEGSNVEHQFLQSDAPLIVRRWGTGQDAKKAHYGRFRLDVGVSINVHAE
jgi:hypothetical protein